MNRRFGYFFIFLCAPFALGAAKEKPVPLPVAPGPQRGLKIVVASDAPALIREAAQQIAAAANSSQNSSPGASPVLQIMAGGTAAQIVSSADLIKAPPEERAFNHLVLVGLPSDPVIQQAWLRDATVIKNSAGVDGLYIFGFGNLLGDIGYIESDRNPFLHSVVIKQAPYETEIITISGSTPPGVALAANAFLKQGLVNGVVAVDWKRGEATLLDRDPLKPGVAIPENLPAQIGNWKRIGITQPGEDEYRGVLAEAGVEPEIIWRAKYYSPGVWDGGGTAYSLQDYNDGLHRRAYGDTLWAAAFLTPAAATEAAAKIASSAKLKKNKNQWSGKLGPLGSEKESAGSLTLQVHGTWVIMSTVPGSASAVTGE